MILNGGFFTMEDFQSYTASFKQPIVSIYRNNKVFAAAPPSGGGITLLTALNILDNFNVGNLKSNSAYTYHLLAESIRRGHNNRSHFVGDPDYYDVPVDQLLSKKRTIEEAVDVIYHLLVLLKSKKITLKEINNELSKRH